MLKLKELLTKILDLLTVRERKQAGILLGMVLVMALLDMIGVASIMPFMAVLANPGLVETNPILAAVYTGLEFQDSQSFIFGLGVLVFVLLVTSLIFKALTTYAQLRFSMMREYSIGRRLIEGYLNQPYSWFLSRHSADLGKNILAEISIVIHSGMTPMMTLITQGVTTFALLVLLIIIDPNLALSVGVVLGFSYVLIYKAISGVLARLGRERIKVNQLRFTAVSEAFGAIKELKLSRLEQVYVNRYGEPALALAKYTASASAISLLPRFALEAVAFGGMLLIVLYLMRVSGDFASALPIVTLYAFAGYRLMPALQQIYAAVAQLRYIAPTLSAMHADLMSLRGGSKDDSREQLFLREKINLNNIVYTYPNAEQPALNGITFEIPVKSTVGLVGVTGSGKTTVVDLVLGLLKPEQGTLKIDGQIIDEQNCRAWQRVVGYVPQQIFLIDDSVAANIAFGVNSTDIDQSAVERAAKIANLHEFVVNDMPNSYQTTVGERGVRLSGGQRQRIGIARALYHSPQVLVLDEATSALDNITEQVVMEAVQNLGHEITIILIAHRLSTVRNCDKIFLLEKGELKGEGNFDELSQTDKRFRTMTEIAN